MTEVLLFYATQAFASEQALKAYLHPTYTADGDLVPSDFMREVALKCYEPACVESAREERAIPLRELVAGFSYSDQWAHLVPEEIRANTVVLIYPPNVAVHPKRATKLLFQAAISYGPPQK